MESDNRTGRPELTAAIDRCRLTGATLVVAKVDRLSRNLAFLAALQESGIGFVAADMPEANELTVHIMAAVAQAECKMIGERTKAALAAAKARGQRLGNPNGAAAFRRADKGSSAATAALIAKTDRHARQLAPTLNRLRDDGQQSLGQLAKSLNAEGIMTPRGGRWHPSSVRNVLARLAAS